MKIGSESDEDWIRIGLKSDNDWIKIGTRAEQKRREFKCTTGAGTVVYNIL
jgi:hypothetical protein